MKFRSPIFWPERRWAACADIDMLSCPPATTMFASPRAMCWAPSATARRPEPQTWLIPQAAAPIGRPAATCAWRAGFWPWAAVSTWPRIVSDTSSAATPERSTTARMAAAPSSCAGVAAKLPLKLPTGVRAAEAITMLVMAILLGRAAPAGPLFSRAPGQFACSAVRRSSSHNSLLPSTTMAARSCRSGRYQAAR